MSSTIKIPYLSGDLAYTVDVIDPTDLSVLQADVALTLVSGVHQATITSVGKLLFDVKHSGNRVEPVPRCRTIVDGETRFVLTGLDSASDGAATLPVNPADDELTLPGWLIVYDETLTRENSVPISVQLVSGPGTAGFSLDLQPITVVSATVTVEGDEIAGYVVFPRLLKGATYAVWRGTAATATAASPFAQRSTGARATFTVPLEPEAGSSGFRIIETLGQETAA